MSFETLLVDRADGVVTITLDRPERKNAANAQMWDELLCVFRDVGLRAEDRVLVITGAGGDFCSGADVGGMAPSRSEATSTADDDGNADGDGQPGGRVHGLASMRHVGDVALALRRLPQPTIAKVRGVAVGAGMNMALLCDLVVASDNARFSEIFARRGLTIDFGGSWVLPRRVGLHRAKELALFADIIDAAEADRIGLVNRVVPDAELDAFVDDWVGRLAAGPPIALAQTKRLLDNAIGITLEQALDDEGAAQTINFATADTAEAVQAFLAKRQPEFQGR
ncbi:MAG: enoyl-CoA hydratase/isomerase family protein [Ilumatobacteraceae bacterium]